MRFLSLNTEKGISNSQLCRRNKGGAGEWRPRPPYLYAMILLAPIVRLHLDLTSGNSDFQVLPR